MNTELIEVWDNWFEATGDKESIRAWNVAKSINTTSNSYVLLDVWAHIIEFNRLSKLDKLKISEVTNAGV